ncbi:MAG TPA: sulfatase-like hydrolase/transferase [Pyrinomonadaceae bacterium]|jgi:arylsulfatase A-like enzyme|nr:sulfatase-like hydrolase/transferase [Pyrinomonadaceae bacterium]
MGKKITRREFVGSAVAASALASVSAKSAEASPPAQRPNVLYIMADDMGWGDLSCYGRPDYRTPNLDRLASEGTRFTHAYSAAPVCTPTRCAFVTGRYPARTRVGLEEPLAFRKQLVERKQDIGLPPEHPTVASLLKSAGYNTALVGKWHLGYLPKYSPVKSGFEEFFGIMSGGADHFTHKDANGEGDLFEAEVPVERVGYTTDLLTEHAAEFLKRRRDAPFFLSLNYTAPHWPWEGPKDEAVSRSLPKGLGGFTSGGSLKVYAEMMKSLDAGVGRVLRALEDAGHARTTLVIFTSDNGGERFSYNWPFTGKKLDLYEGGIRVPAFARWPGVVPAGRTTEQVAVTMDWTATILAAAGARANPDYPLDGEDLLPFMRGEREAFERTLFWRNGAQAAVRAGRWKYLKVDDKTERLFDLLTDEREQADSRAARPEIFERLRAEYSKWDAQVLKRPEA